MKLALTGMSAIVLLLTGCHFNAGIDIPEHERHRKYTKTTDNQNNNEYVGLFRDGQ